MRCNLLGGFSGNNTGGLVNAAEGLSPRRRLITPALGGTAALVCCATGVAKMNQQHPCAHWYIGSITETDGQFDVDRSGEIAGLAAGRGRRRRSGREGAVLLYARHPACPTLHAA